MRLPHGSPSLEGDPPLIPKLRFSTPSKFIRTLIGALSIACLALGQSFEQIKTKAEDGDARAQFNLGRMYAEGRGVTKDEEEAFKWVRRAAEQGHTAAQNRLGIMYTQGRGVAKDEVEAVKWIRKAAEQGGPGAQTNLGSRYAIGRGVQKDEKEAVKWFLKAAEQGYPAALKALERMRSRRQSAAQYDREATSIVRVAYKDKYHPVVGARGLNPVIQVEGKRRSVRRAKFIFAPKGGVSFKHGYIEIENRRLETRAIEDFDGGGTFNHEIHFQARLRSSADLENCFVAIRIRPEIGEEGMLFHEIPDLNAGDWKFVRFTVSTHLNLGAGQAQEHFFSNGLEVFPKPRFEWVQRQTARQRPTQGGR